MLLRLFIHLSVLTLTASGFCKKNWHLWPRVNVSEFREIKIHTACHPPFFTPPLQSPININSAKVTTRCLPDLEFHDLLCEDVYVNMENTGSLVQFTLRNDNVVYPRVTGGPLAQHGEYLLENLHCHWGCSECGGSEHTINGHRYAIEGHCVLFNSKYGCIEEAGKYEDGLAVIAFFLKLSKKDNHQLQKVVELLPKIKQPGTKTKVKAGQVMPFFKEIGHARDYFVYPGSLTTPPYSENVIWIVYPCPTPVSSRQVEAFRNLLNCDLEKIRNNFREVQKFNNRPLIYSACGDDSEECRCKD